MVFIPKSELFVLSGDGGRIWRSRDPEGHFFALDERTGKKPWNFQTGITK